MGVDDGAELKRGRQPGHQRLGDLGRDSQDHPVVGAELHLAVGELQSGDPALDLAQRLQPPVQAHGRALGLEIGQGWFDKGGG